MASKKEPYETKIVRNQAAANKLVRRGWEIVSTTGGLLGLAPSWTMRRDNPKYKAPKGK